MGVNLCEFFKLRMETVEEIRMLEPCDAQARAAGDFARVFRDSLVEQDVWQAESREKLSFPETPEKKGCPLYDSSLLGYLTLDRLAVVRDVNYSAARMLGIERSLLRRQSFPQYVGPEDRDAFRRHFREVLETGKPQACELKIKTGRNRFFDARLESAPLNLPFGETQLVLTTLADISELKKTRYALSRKREILQALIDNTPWIVFWKDAKGKYLGCNRHFAALAGLESVSEAVGKTDAHFPWTIEEPAALREEESKVLKTGEAILKTLKKVVFSENKKEVVFETHRVPLAGEKGKVDGTLAILCDVTEKIREAEKRRELESRLRRSQKTEAIGALAGGIAHEFNNILSVIIGYSELQLQDSVAGSADCSKAMEILKAGLEARELISQILAFSRWDRGAFSIVKFENVVADSIKMVRAFLPSTIEIRLDTQDTNCLVRVDQTQMQRVVVNICANIMRAMEKKHGAITVKLESTGYKKGTLGFPPGLKPGPCIRLRITGEGPFSGWNVEDQSRHPPFTSKGPGKKTEPDLSFSRSIVRRHNGVIAVENECGKGPVFTICIPCFTSLDATANTRKASKKTGGNEKILFIDDDPRIVKVQKHALERLGYRVIGMTDPTLALELFDKSPNAFDIVITDMTMPLITGDVVAVEIKYARPDIPVILCTGFNEEIGKDEAFMIGASHFIRKPYEFKELAAAIRDSLDH